MQNYLQWINDLFHKCKRFSIDEWLVLFVSKGCLHVCLQAQPVHSSYLNGHSFCPKELKSVNMTETETLEGIDQLNNNYWNDNFVVEPKLRECALHLSAGISWLNECSSRQNKLMVDWAIYSGLWVSMRGSSWVKMNEYKLMTYQIPH